MGASQIRNRALMIIVSMAATAAILPDAHAGKRTSGGGKDPCRASTSTPIVIKSIQADSSRRIHVISTPGSMNGNTAPAEWFEVRDAAGTLVLGKGGLGFPNLSDAYIEGATFIPGATYQVTLGSWTACMAPTAPVTVTLEADAPEKNPPVISDMKLIFSYLSSQFLWITTTDDTAIQSFKVFVDGVPMPGVPTSVAPRFWTNTAGNYQNEGGSILSVQVDGTNVNKTGNVTVEVTDIYGNTTTMTKLMTL